MSAPTIISTYPADGDTGIPIGESLEIVFDKALDLESVKNHIVLYGNDFDMTSGPDSAQWIKEGDGSNPFFLRSPGFQGIAECKYELIYLDASGEVLDPQPKLNSSNLNDYRCKVIITPSKPLAADVEYNLYIVGDPDSTGRGVGSRTVFDVFANENNLGLGDLITYGSYAGSATDTIHVEVTESGSIGSAKYKWWFDSEGEASAVLGRVTARRFRRLRDNVQIRFSGSNLQVGDRFSFDVKPTERLVTNVSLSFITNNGNYSVAPESPSTPALAEPPDIPALLGFENQADFYILSSVPGDGDSNLSLETRQIVVEFNNELDPSSVSEEKVSLFVHPVSGVYDDTYEPYELQTKLTIDGNLLIIEY